MAYTPPNPNGQTTSANSAPVVIASDQSTVKTKLATDIADVIGTITTATSTVTLTSLSGVGSATVTIFGTYAGVNVTFETFDGTNWVAIPAQQAATPTPTQLTATGVLTTNSVNRYRISPLLGEQQLRVRATAYTSGTANVIIEPSAQFTQSLVNVATMPTTAVTQSTSPWITREAGSATATITQVTPTTTSTVVKAANTARKRLILFNGGSADCYIAYGATASSTAFTFILPSLATTTIMGDEYTGAVNAIWTATGGNSMQVTETV